MIFFIGYRTDKPLNVDSALLLQVSPIEDCFVLFCANVSPIDCALPPRVSSFARGGDSGDVKKNGEPRRGKGSRAIPLESLDKGRR